MVGERVALTFDNVTFAYPNVAQPALDGCSVALPTGSKIAILGRNGSGKSTFFLHCNGILQPAAGTVFLHDQPLAYDRKGLRALRQQVNILFQQADDQLFSADVRQDISFGPLNLGLSASVVAERVAAAVTQCGLDDVVDRPIHALSGGQKARVALAGVLAMQPDVLLLDEPTTSLDPLMRIRLFEILETLHEQGKTIIVATHEYELARHWAQFVMVLDAGRVLLAGETDAVFAERDTLAHVGLDRPWYAQFAQPEGAA